MAGIEDVFNMPAASVIAAKPFYTGATGAAGEHLCDCFDLDIVQTASIQKGCPALIGHNEFFQMTRMIAVSSGVVHPPASTLQVKMVT